MRRRGMLGAALLGAIAVPQGVCAQPTTGPRRIGFIHPRTVAPDSPTVVILRSAWQALGYVEGQTVLLRSAAGDPSRVPALVHELVGLGAGVLIVNGAAAVRQASEATRTAPIVAIDLETDPVRAGYAASLARPGRNITGLFLDQPSLAGKWIELLREAAPDVERIAILWDRSTGVDQLEIARAAARAKGFTPTIIELGQIRNFDDALRGLAGPPQAGIVQLSSPGFSVQAAAFAQAARRHRLPAISFLKTYARAGVLMTYGPIQEVYFARAVALADRILKGDNPGELPIEAPSRFELVVNVATARAIGRTIAPMLLLRADEVIE